MKLRKYSELKTDSGTTLVELLAAIAILSIIVVSFLGVFIQGARTNSRASDLNEMTFIAQGHMEEIVHYSQTTPNEELLTKKGFVGNLDKMERSFDEAGYHWEIILSKVDETDVLYKVIIKVSNEGQKQIILENRLAFGMRDSE